MNSKNKNLIKNVNEESKEDQIITFSIEELSIEEQLEMFAELIVEQLILEQNENNS
jgi:hypothetical protein